MTEQSAFAREHKLPRTYAAELLTIDHGEGVYLYDTAGRRYLDMGAGIAVNALGYGRDDLADIAAAQMRRLIHISNLYTTEPTIRLAERLASSRIGGFDPDFTAVHFGNSGAEANEAAIKYARAYSFRTHGPGHHKLLGFEGGFHGRTIGALSMTQTPAYREPFEPLLPGCDFLPFNDIDALEKQFGPSYAGVIIEPVQGEGGLRQVTPAFAAALNRLCRQHDVVLIADEVQSGLGRTGRIYGSEPVGLEPDIVTLSKPLAGGLPLSATLTTRRINDILAIGDHGSTFGGGPVTTAVALQVWDTITNEDFLASVRRLAGHMDKRLNELSQRFAFAGTPVGLGLLRGLPILASDESLKEVMGLVLTTARENGLLVLRSGSNVVRIAPPLVITEQEIDEGCEILAKTFDTVWTQQKGALHG